MRRFFVFLLLGVFGFSAACLPGCTAMNRGKEPQPTYEIPNSMDSPTGEVKPERWRQMKETLRGGNSPEAQKISDELDGKFAAST